MKNATSFALLLALGIGLALGALLLGMPMLVGAQGPDTAFTYQGRLLKDGSYVDGVTCNFRFGLYGNPTGNPPLGTGIQPMTSTVSDGYFTVVLNFGVVITGARYLETAVQCPGDAAFNTLSPRVTLRPAPYAQYAQSAPWSGISGVPASVGPYTAGYGLNLAGNQFDVVTGTIQQRVGNSCAASNSIRVINADGTVTCEADDNTTYTAGDGLDLAGTQFSVNATEIQGTGLTVSSNNLDVDFGSGTNQAARGNHNHDATYINAGETAGGDLTGTYPNPTVADDAVGMAETRETMGRGVAGDISDGGTIVMFGANYWWPTSAVFTPMASGNCLVIVTVDVSSSGIETRTEAWVRAARRVGVTSSSGDNLAYMASDSWYAHLGSTTVADIMPVTGGQSTQFGCYLWANDTSWTDDERWHCALAYLCQ